MIRRPPRSPLFPYPTPFRSRRELPRGQARLPRLDRRRAPERAGGDVAAVDEAAVAGDAVQGERALVVRSEEHTSELQSRLHLVCRLLLEKKNVTGSD